MDQLYFPELITMDLHTVQWHASLIFLLCLSVRRSVTSLQILLTDRRGVELGFRAKTGMAFEFCRLK